MNSQQNKAIVRDYLHEIVNKGNLAAFDSYISEDVVFNNIKGFKQQYPARMQTVRSAFSDYNVAIEDQIAEGDKVVMRVTFRVPIRTTVSYQPRSRKGQNSLV